MSRYTILRYLGRYSPINKLENEAKLRLHRIVAHAISEDIDSDEAKAQAAFRGALPYSISGSLSKVKHEAI